VVFGSSYLGNLYEALSYERKLALMKEWFACTGTPLVVDTAGKYGAGLALEVLGRGLGDLNIGPEEVVISNKLGWYRIPLKGKEPSFEPGVWKGLGFDCAQRFGYREIRECFDQGIELLGGVYQTDLVSVHDPDEYLLQASSPGDRDKRFTEILESYRALFDLKAEGRVQAVGIGAKDWTIIRELYAEVDFDWVMIANSFTVYSHPAEILEFMDILHENGTGIINSGIFHGGFLTGGEQFDYRNVDPESERGLALYSWREAFYRVCRKHLLDPAEVCMHFSISHPAISAVALNTSHPEKVGRNLRVFRESIPGSFWDELKEAGLVSPAFPYL